LLAQAAQHLDGHPGPLGHFFRKVSKTKNRNVAGVACARKLAVIAWYMLTDNQPYRYAQPDTVHQKLARLRILATGTKRTVGIPKGSKRTEIYGSGIATRGIPGLDRIYQFN